MWCESSFVVQFRVVGYQVWAHLQVALESAISTTDLFGSAIGTPAHTKWRPASWCTLPSLDKAPLLSTSSPVTSPCLHPIHLALLTGFNVLICQNVYAFTKYS